MADEKAQQQGILGKFWISGHVTYFTCDSLILDTYIKLKHKEILF